jgi:23S rRNA pseudouridine1911/1915/1917 synthase
VKKQSRSRKILRLTGRLPTNDLMPEFHVTKAEAGARLDQFLAAKLARLSRSRIQHLIKSGHVLVNTTSAKSAEKLRSDDMVILHEPEPIPASVKPEEIALDVLFEDDDLLVINKPAGMVVHPAAGNAAHTMVNALLKHCTNLSGIGGEQRPGIVHRLDKETSGCIVVAKNDFAHGRLARQFAERAVTKIYLALADGFFKTKRGVVETLIGRHPVHRKKMSVVERGGRLAKTEWRVLAELARGSLVECTLHTGRTHQIRVHLKHLGHPVLGDKLYAPKLAADFPHQMLHAWRLGFAHPRSDEPMRFCSPVPENFLKAGVPPLQCEPTSKPQ